MEKKEKKKLCINFLFPVTVTTNFSMAYYAGQISVESAKEFASKMTDRSYLTCPLVSTIKNSSENIIRQNKMQTSISLSTVF